MYWIKFKFQISYWAILNCLIYNKNIPAITTLFVDNILISNFFEKPNIFSNYFATICTPINNTSVLPPF